MTSEVFRLAVPLLSPSSLAFRATLARLVSPLRRVRPRVPFYKLAIHRAPTLALYRSLLRYAPDENIRWRVQRLFRQHQHETGTERTKKQLLKGYKWLDVFKKAREGDEKQRAILDRYSRLIVAKADKEHLKELARKEAAWQARLRSRPILTGGIIKPTLYNRPLPRMKPQPVDISRMIATRIKTRDRRFARLAQLTEDADDLHHEMLLEMEAIRYVGELPDAGKRNFEYVYSGPEIEEEWSRPINKAKEYIYTLLNRDVARSRMPISPQLQEIARAARREKIANKTRERERERRGEILNCTLKRARKGPPPHVLVRMTAEERHADRMVRRVGEVGYVGMVKRRMGVKLRDGGKGLARENGTDLEGEQLERLRKMEKEYWIERTKRMKQNANLEL